MTNSGSTAIVAIFKNEAPYILEWIAFHLSIGIDFFYIADNESNDGTTALLSALDKLNIIKHIKFPTPANSPPQLPAYEKIMSEFRERHDWFFFIDADEFIMPQSDRSLKDLIGQFSSRPEIGGIALNWAVFGSSNFRNYSEGLVMERFTKRGEKVITLNKHFKSVVRAEAYEGTLGNPHCFKLKEGYQYAHTDGNRVTNLVAAVDGLSKGVCWESFRLNHYVVKSYAEFINKKNRGRATKVSNSVENRNESFFREHDVNDVIELPASAIVELTKQRMEILKELILDNNSPEVISDTKFVLNNLVHGYHDTTLIEDNVISIRGWAFSSDNENLEFTVHLNDQVIPVSSVQKSSRPDVRNVYADAPEDCGFVLHCQVFPTASEDELQTLRVEARADKCVVELKKANS